MACPDCMDVAVTIRALLTIDSAVDDRRPPDQCRDGAKSDSTVIRYGETWSAQSAVSVPWQGPHML